MRASRATSSWYALAPCVCRTACGCTNRSVLGERRAWRLTLTFFTTLVTRVRYIKVRRRLAQVPVHDFHRLGVQDGVAPLREGRVDWREAVNVSLPDVADVTKVHVRVEGCRWVDGAHDFVQVVASNDFAPLDDLAGSLPVRVLRQRAVPEHERVGRVVEQQEVGAAQRGADL